MWNRTCLGLFVLFSIVTSVVCAYRYFTDMFFFELGLSVMGACLSLLFLCLRYCSEKLSYALVNICMGFALVVTFSLYIAFTPDELGAVVAVWLLKCFAFASVLGLVATLVAFRWERKRRIRERQNRFVRSSLTY